MGFLDIWDKPELFKQFSFDKIDEKVEFIEKYRRQHEELNNILKELNNRVDIDYVKDSDAIEGEPSWELKHLEYDEGYEELYTNAKTFARTTQQDFDEFYWGKYRTIMKDGRLLIYRKDPETGRITKYKSNMPTHLQAVKDALAQARKDRELISQGEQVDVDLKFIERLHEKLFEGYIQINTRLNRNPNEPPIKPEGYGKFRRTLMLGGLKHKYIVEVEGANWQPTDSDDVESEMKQLVEKYNKSTLHPILKALIFKSCFIKIHPFRDGNGRTSRMLLNYMLVRYGIPTVTIRGVHKNAYFEAMNFAIEKEDYSKLVKMIKLELNQRCDQYLKLISDHQLEHLLNGEISNCSNESKATD